MARLSRLQTQIGARLREAREFADLPQKAAAAKLGVKPTTLAGWESGTHAPRTVSLHRMARVYGCSADFLLCRADDPSGLELADHDVVERVAGELLARARKAAASIVKKAKGRSSTRTK